MHCHGLAGSACPRAGAQPECASRKKPTDSRERVFFIRPQALEATSKNALSYGDYTSGAIIYAYVGGNPVSLVDFLGLCDPDKCAELLGDINSLRNELAKRQGDLIANKLGLPATGPMSIAGHVQQFQNKQAALRKKLKDYDSQNCPGGGGGTGDAWKLATQAPPTPGPGPSSSSSNSSAWMIGGGVVLIGAALVFAPEITVPALVFGAAAGR